MKNIILDLDSTIIDTCKSIINLHNKLNENQIEYVDNYKWNFSPMINTKEELTELFKLFDNEEFYNKDTLVVFDDAIQFINELSEYNNVTICSKHETLRRPISAKWIHKTFPNVKLIFTDTFDKSIVGKCDIALDDKTEALDSIDAKYKVIYGFYDWNKSYDGLRVNSWLEFKQLVDKL